jgi:hypothetical protein
VALLHTACKEVCIVFASPCSTLSVLFGFVVIGLIIKKVREKSNRTWFEFMLDSSKQMAGASWLHVLNIVFSFALHHLGGDECSWYWIHITVDTTLGVFVNYQLHYLIYKVMVPKWCSPTMAANFKSGDYGSASGKVQWGKYFRQLLVWLFIVSIMKFTMVLIMLIAHIPLVEIATWFLSPFRKNAELKLIVVMVLTPLVMNMVQFWITDSFTKKKAAPIAAEIVELKHPDANQDSCAYEEVPLTRADGEEEEEEVSEFPVSPFAIVFNNPEVDRRPRGLDKMETEMKKKKKEEPKTVGNDNGDSL